MLDSSDISAVTSGLNAVIEASVKMASAARADDHLKWLLSSQLIDAFDMYDPGQLKAGFAFTAQAAACTFGMGGIDKCAEQLDKWIAAPHIDRKNLFMRTFAYNQKDLQKEVEQAMAQARAAAAGVVAPGLINWQLVQKSIKGVVSAFKTVDSSWDEYVRNKNQPGAAFKYKFEALAYQKISEVGRSIFRKGLGGKGDAALVAGLGALLYGRTGEVAEKLRFDELMYRIDPENPVDPKLSKRDPRNPNLPTTTEAGTPRHLDPEAAQQKAKAAREAVSKTLDEALAKGETSNYHQIRVGVVVTLLEAINLATQIGKPNMSDEDKLKMAGTSFALISSSLDLAYTGAKLIREHAPALSSAAGGSRAAVRGAGETVRGGLKLASGVFSCAAGVIGVWFDYQAWDREKNSNWLQAIYLSRTAVGTIGSVLAVVAGMSYCGTWISRLSLKVAQDSAAKEAAMTAGRLLTALGERVALLRWVARVNLAGLVLTGGEVVVRVFILDDALESWCKRSVFRKDKSTGIFGSKPFESQEEEFKALYTAYAETK